MKWLNFPLCIMIALLAISCNETTPETQPIVETQDSTQQVIPEVAPTPKGPFFNEAEQELLGKHFKKESIDGLSDIMYELRGAKTDVELAKAFHNSTALQEKIEKNISDKNIDIYPMLEQLRPLDSVMQYCLSSCVAECTEFRFAYNILELQKLAAQTTGDKDDAFFDLLNTVEGEVGGRDGGWYKFFGRTWDYGGGSMLGDGSCLDFLAKSWTLMERTDLFKSNLASIREACIMDMGHPIYMAKKEVVLKELKKILSINYLSPKEKIEVELILADVNKGKKGEVSIQFGCKDKDCDWGG